METTSKDKSANELTIKLIATVEELARAVEDARQRLREYLPEETIRVMVEEGDEPHPLPRKVLRAWGGETPESLRARVQDANEQGA